MIDPQLHLRTSRALLRPLIMEDADAFAPLANDPSMWAYFTLNLADPLHLGQWMQAAITDRTAGRRPFTIIDRETNQIAGSSSIGNISWHDLRLEIGWSWLGPKFRSTGINLHAKYAMMKYAFETLKFERVEFKTDFLNQRARRGLEKIGATAEGVLRSHMTMWNDRRRDSIYYSVLKTEWPNLCATVFKEITGYEFY